MALVPASKIVNWGETSVERFPAFSEESPDKRGFRLIYRAGGYPEEYVRPPVSSGLPGAPPELWGHNQFQMMTIVSEYVACTLEFLYWSWKTFSTAEELQAVRLCNAFVASLPTGRLQLPPADPQLLSVWKAFTYIFFHGLSKAGRTGRYPSIPFADRGPHSTPAAWLYDMVGDSGWRRDSPAYSNLRTWLNKMATRLASHYPTHDWSQPRSVDVSALHGGAGVQRTGDGRGTHRRTRQAFMPRFPLRVSKESTAKNPTAKFTMFKVEEKKIKCGIPASGDLYAMCFQAASDVMMAFKEASAHWPKELSSDMKHHLVSTFRFNILTRDEGPLTGDQGVAHEAYLYPQYIASCVVGWEHAMVWIDRMVDLSEGLKPTNPEGVRIPLPGVAPPTFLEPTPVIASLLGYVQAAQQQGQQQQLVGQLGQPRDAGMEQQQQMLAGAEMLMGLSTAPAVNGMAGVVGMGGLDGALPGVGTLDDLSLAGLSGLSGLDSMLQLGLDPAVTPGMGGLGTFPADAAAAAAAAAAVQASAHNNGTAEGMLQAPAAAAGAAGAARRYQSPFTQNAAPSPPPLAGGAAAGDDPMAGAGGAAGGPTDYPQATTGMPAKPEPMEVAKTGAMSGLEFGSGFVLEGLSTLGTLNGAFLPADLLSGGGATGHLLPGDISGLGMGPLGLPGQAAGNGAAGQGMIPSQAMQQSGGMPGGPPLQLQPMEMGPNGAGGGTGFQLGQAAGGNGSLTGNMSPFGPQAGQQPAPGAGYYGVMPAQGPGQAPPFQAFAFPSMQPPGGPPPPAAFPAPGPLGAAGYPVSGPTGQTEPTGHSMGAPMGYGPRLGPGHQHPGMQAHGGMQPQGGLSPQYPQHMAPGVAAVGQLGPRLRSATGGSRNVRKSKRVHTTEAAEQTGRYLVPAPSSGYGGNGNNGNNGNSGNAAGNATADDFAASVWRTRSSEIITSPPRYRGQAWTEVCVSDSSGISVSLPPPGAMPPPLPPPASRRPATFRCIDLPFADECELSQRLGRELLQLAYKLPYNAAAAHAGQGQGVLGDAVSRAAPSAAAASLHGSMEALLARGAPVDHTDSIHALSAVRRAAQVEDPHAVQLLLEAGAEPEQVSGAWAKDHLSQPMCDFIGTLLASPQQQQKQVELQRQRVAAATLTWRHLRLPAHTHSTPHAGELTAAGAKTHTPARSSVSGPAGQQQSSSPAAGEGTYLQEQCSQLLAVLGYAGEELAGLLACAELTREVRHAGRQQQRVPPGQQQQDAAAVEPGGAAAQQTGDGVTHGPCPMVLLRFKDLATGRPLKHLRDKVLLRYSDPAVQAAIDAASAWSGPDGTTLSWHLGPHFTDEQLRLRQQKAVPVLARGWLQRPNGHIPRMLGSHFVYVRDRDGNYVHVPTHSTVASVAMLEDLDCNVKAHRNAIVWRGVQAPTLPGLDPGWPVRATPEVLAADKAYLLNQLLPELCSLIGRGEIATGAPIGPGSGDGSLCEVVRLLQAPTMPSGASTASAAAGSQEPGGAQPSLGSQQALATPEQLPGASGADASLAAFELTEAVLLRFTRADGKRAMHRLLTEEGLDDLPPRDARVAAGLAGRGWRFYHALTPHQVAAMGEMMCVVQTAAACIAANPTLLACTRLVKGEDGVISVQARGEGALLLGAKPRPAGDLSWSARLELKPSTDFELHLAKKSGKRTAPNGDNTLNTSASGNAAMPGPGPAGYNASLVGSVPPQPHFGEPPRDFMPAPGQGPGHGGMHPSGGLQGRPMGHPAHPNEALMMPYPSGPPGGVLMPPRIAPSGVHGLMSELSAVLAHAAALTDQLAYADGRFDGMHARGAIGAVQHMLAMYAGSQLQMSLPGPGMPSMGEPGPGPGPAPGMQQSMPGLGLPRGMFGMALQVARPEACSVQHGPMALSGMMHGPVAAAPAGPGQAMGPGPGTYTTHSNLGAEAAAGQGPSRGAEAGDCQGHGHNGGGGGGGMSSLLPFNSMSLLEAPTSQLLTAAGPSSLALWPADLPTGMGQGSAGNAC